MVGRERAQMFTNYIADFEHGGYRLPRNIADSQGRNEFYKGHRGATTADVFAPHKWDGHTPDDLVAMALAHRAAGRIAQPVPVVTVPTLWTPREADKPFHVKPELTRTEGLVSIVDDRYGGGDDPAAGDWMARMMV
jgi:hypothetical protein